MKALLICHELVATRCRAQSEEEKEGRNNANVGLQSMKLRIH